MSELDLIKSKIITTDKLDDYLEDLRVQNKTVVFTNGCFDLLHRGHIEYLAKASDLGDVLFIGLNSDKSVTSIKGPDRPVQDQETRALILASLQFVDAVTFFEEDTPYELIKKVQPDILTKGADYKAEEIVGYDIVKSKGGDIITIELVPGLSTSEIIKKIK